MNPFQNVAELLPQSCHHIACHSSARVLQTLRSLYLSHVIAAATYAEYLWQFHRSDCRNTLIYAYATSPNLPTCDISLGSLKLPAPENGEFVELILL
jgi:hypothetical protein